MAGLLTERTPANETFDPNEVMSKDHEFDPNEVLATPTEPQGELGAGARVGLGFMSGEAEKRRYLTQKFPGIKFAKWKDQDIVYLPGEKSPRYVDDPKLTWTDVADFAGDVPGMVGGTLGALGGGGTPASIALAGVGAAAGEAGRKAIGRKLFLGEDIVQPSQIGSDIKDIGISGVAGAGGQAVANAAVGYLGRKAAQRAVENIGRDTGKKVIAQGIGAGGEGIVGPGAGQAAASQVDDANRFRINMQGEGQIRGELGQAANPIDDAIANTPQPKNMKEMILQHKEALARGEVPDLPSADRLREIEQLLPDLKTRPLPIHYAMLKNKQSNLVLRTQFDALPGEGRMAVDAYDQRMKAEIQSKIGQIIGEAPKTKTDAGFSLMKDVAGIYKEQRKAVGPLFEKIHEVPIDPASHVNGLAMRLAEEVPGFGEAISVNPETGKLALQPFRPDMGVSKKAYGEMNTVLGSLNQDQLSFKQMQRIREYLRKEINPMDPGATKDLQGIRKAMLAHMEDLVHERAPDVEVKKTFQAWAKNERRLERFEDMLGGKMETLEAEYRANPDRVLANIFANPNTVETAKELLGEKRFASLAGDYLNNLREMATDSAKNQLSMANFARHLKQNRGVIEAAIGKEQLTRLSALADLGKIIPDRGPINPSNTAPTGVVASALRGGKKILGAFSGNLSGVADQAASDIAASLDKRAAKDAVAYFNLLLEQGGETPTSLAERLLPYVQSKQSKALLKAMTQAGSRRVLGPASDGILGRPEIRGPEGQ